MQLDESIKELDELIDSVNELALTMQSVTTALAELDEIIDQGKFSDTRYSAIQRQKLLAFENALNDCHRLSLFFSSLLSGRPRASADQKQIVRACLLKTGNLAVLLRNLIEAQTPITLAVAKKSIEFDIRNLSEDEIKQRLQMLRRSSVTFGEEYHRIHINQLETKLSELAASERSMTGGD